MSNGYDGLEQQIINGKYTIAQKVLYGGIMYGGFALPVNFIKVICTTIFPPLGELLNIISDFIVSDFPYFTWDAMVAIFQNLHRIIYCFILTSMFYIPGLIYTLSNITCKMPNKNNANEGVIKIAKY